MATLPFYQKIVKTEPALYRLTLVLSTVIGLIGVLGLAGHLLHQKWMTDWGILNSAPITSSTALAIICIAIAIPLAFSSIPLNKKPFSLRFVFYICILFPLVYGGYYTIYRLILAHFNFIDIMTKASDFPHSSFLAAFCIVLISASILSFTKWQDKESIIIYGVGLPAILIFNITLFVMTGYLKNLPPLSHFTPTFPTTIGVLIAAITLLVATIPFRGLFVPFLCKSKTVVIMSTLSILGGLMILLKEILNIDALQSLGMPNSIVLTEYFTISAFSAIIMSTLFIIISLRALYNYNVSMQQAILQKKQQDAETLLRRIGEVIHNNSSLQESCQRVTEMLGAALNCDYTLMTCLDEGTKNLVEPSCEYYNPSGRNGKNPSVLHRTDILVQLISAVCKNENSIELNSLDSEMAGVYLEFLQYGQFRDALATPILNRENCFGVIILANTNEREAFTQIERQVVKSIAEQIVIARSHYELLNELRKTEANFKKILEANIIGIFFWQTDGAITYANQAFLNMVGYSREDLGVGLLNWKQLSLSKEGSVKLGNNLEIAGKGSDLPIQLQYQTKSGQTIDVIQSLTTFNGTDKEGVSFVVDITNLKQVEKALLEKNQELEQFASIASHDLQAPLRKIKAFLSLLKQDALERLTDSDKDYIERIELSANRMQQLIGDLLSLARITRNVRPFELVNVKDVLHEVLHDLAVEISQKEAIIEIGEMLTIEADPTQMYQLFQNLISNSLKYKKPDEPPHIQINMQQIAKNRCRLIVEDNGLGFELEKAEWIFGAFTRLLTSNEQTGTGIGLAICRKILERHQGRIWAVSKPGVGSTFIAELPIHQPQRAFFLEGQPIIEQSAFD